jgi:hypothetical protein
MSRSLGDGDKIRCTRVYDNTAQRGRLNRCEIYKIPRNTHKYTRDSRINAQDTNGNAPLCHNQPCTRPLEG